MTTAVSVPESVRSYFTDSSVSAIVDHILQSEAAEFPVDLDWEEVRDFHVAHVAAVTVRTDYALLLLDLWESVWAEPLRAHGITQDVPFDEYPEGTLPSPEVFWYDSLYRICYFPGDSGAFLYLSVYFDSKGKLELSLAHETEEGENTQLSLPAAWSFDEDIESYVARDALVKIQEDTSSIDVTTFQQLAFSAITALVEAVAE